MYQYVCRYVYRYTHDIRAISISITPFISRGHLAGASCEVPPPESGGVGPTPAASSALSEGSVTEAMTVSITAGS